MRPLSSRSSNALAPSAALMVPATTPNVTSGAATAVTTTAAVRSPSSAAAELASTPPRVPSARVMGIPGGLAGPVDRRFRLPVPHPARELHHGELRHEHRPGVPQPRDDGGVRIEHLIAVGLRAPGRLVALRRQEILHAVGNPVQRAAPPPPTDLAVRLRRFDEGALAREA